MNATTTLLPDIAERRVARHLPWHNGLRILVGMFQVASLLGVILCLLLTGLSGWSLLAGLVAAGFAKASLAMMDREPEFAHDNDAINQVLLRIYGKHPRGHHDLKPSC